MTVYVTSMKRSQRKWLALMLLAGPSLTLSYGAHAQVAAVFDAKTYQQFIVEHQTQLKELATALTIAQIVIRNGQALQNPAAADVVGVLGVLARQLPPVGLPAPGQYSLIYQNYNTMAGSPPLTGLPYMQTFGARSNATSAALTDAAAYADAVALAAASAPTRQTNLLGDALKDEGTVAVLMALSRQLGEISAQLVVSNTLAAKTNKALLSYYGSQNTDAAQRMLADQASLYPGSVSPVGMITGGMASPVTVGATPAQGGIAPNGGLTPTLPTP